MVKFGYNIFMQHNLQWRTTEAVNQFLDTLFARRTEEAKQADAVYGTLWEYIAEAVIGGKRIRPYLVMVGYGAFAGRIVPVAAAQELLHVAMLMHDDVIDEDMVRRGRKNINGHYLDRYAPHMSRRLAVHHAYSAGVLAGDTLLSEAYLSINQSQLDDTTKVALLDVLHRSIFEVIGGELMDIEAGLLKTLHIEPENVARYKTASYSFVGPLVMGAMCAGADELTRERLKTFGEYAGIAFQLQDDLLGIYGDSHKLGKTMLLDLKEAKETHMIQEHRAMMNAAQAVRFEAVFGDEHASLADFQSLRADIEASGARARTEERIEECYQRALEAISQLSNPTQRHELTHLIQVMRHREL